MRVIFLDIDGVLNSLMWYKQREKMKGHRSYFERDIEELDPRPLELINRLVQYSDAKVVISSTWRILHTVEEIKSMFDIVMPDNVIDIIDATEELPGIRGNEIQKWLDSHTNVRNYVIIDDDSDMKPSQMSRFVKTKHDTGFLLHHYLKARKILGVRSGYK